MGSEKSEEQIFKTISKKGIPFSRLELLGGISLSMLMFISGGMEMGLIIIAVLLLFAYLQSKSGTLSLEFDKESLAYMVGKVSTTICWKDVECAELKGNKFTGKHILITGSSLVSINGRAPLKRRSIMIVDSFDETIEEILSLITTRITGKASFQA